ncbi:putative snoRNA binding domain protein [Methanobrevibacter cuticularis]|uniref:Putative snoRNA binding domain protein n=1 Tax=Methanobrevibacter cuticularis TaxID=47311 RepID=A0A166FGM6_9EURY|nr:ATP-binding protein [Methanobrevibacter cuticularis]KZX17653.1 putative snoRNA binding domain protein [Methanobrevibacter cuticularis]
MEAYIVNCIVGFIAFNEKLAIVDYKLFNETDIPSKMVKIRNNEILPEEIELIKNITDDYDKIVIESNNRLSSYTSLFTDEKNEITEIGQKIEVEVPNKGGEHLRSNFKEKMIDLGFSSPEEFNDKFTSIYEKIAILEMKESSEEEDKLIIQSIASIDEIDESISKLVERIREWNNIYFPEIDIIQNNENYIKLIAENENREDVMKNPPESLKIDFDNGTNGADIEDEDISIINDFAKSIQSLQKSRKKIEEYIDTKMKKLAPNLRNLVGSSLGAKLIAHGGGLKRIATYPSGTIQIMGAEKALFRHLKTGKRPPKHGLIFQHPEVRTSPWWIRGKIARTLALKISLSVRKDVFSGKFDPIIEESFLEKVEKIKKDNPFPKKTRKRREEERNQETGYSNKSKKYEKKHKKAKKRKKGNKRK